MSNTLWTASQVHEQLHLALAKQVQEKECSADTKNQTHRIMRNNKSFNALNLSFKFLGSLLYSKI